MGNPLTFALRAEVQAFTAEDLINTSAGGPPVAASAWKMLAQTPLATHEAILEHLAWTIDGRRVDPASTTGIQHMNDPADDAAVIDSRLAARVGRQMRLKPRKLFLRSTRKNRDPLTVSLRRP